MNNSTKKSYLFFSKDGFTYDKSNRLTNNMQLFGSAKGRNIDEAFKNFKEEQSYLLQKNYDKVIAIQTVSSAIINLRLKGDKQMSLIPQDIFNKIPNLYETENQKDKICYVKLFLPNSNWTWYIIEIDKQDNNTCFGFVDGLEQELGYFTIRELENLKGMFGLKVELDVSFKPTKLSKIRASI